MSISAMLTKVIRKYWKYWDNELNVKPLMQHFPTRVDLNQEQINKSRTGSYADWGLLACQSS